LQTFGHHPHAKEKKAQAAEGGKKNIPLGHGSSLSALPPANLTYFLPQGGQKKEICRVDQL
jgi:hypothetical protein